MTKEDKCYETELQSLNVLEEIQQKHSENYFQKISKYALNVGSIYASIRIYRRNKMTKESQNIGTELQVHNEKVLEDFEQKQSDENLQKMVTYALNIYFTRKQEESREVLKQIFLIISKINKDNAIETYLYMRNKMDPYLCSKIFNAIDNGIIDKFVAWIEKKMGTKMIMQVNDAIKTNEKLNFVIVTFSTLASLIFIYLDFFKDVALSSNILNAIGGSSALYDFSTQFGPAIVFVLILSTFYPMALANIEMLINDKGNLVFLKMKKTNGRMKNIFILFLNCGMFFASPLILINVVESQKEKI